MTIRSSRAVAPRARSTPRQKVWVGTANQGDVAVSNNGSVIISSFAPDDLAILKATVVRVRGFAQFAPSAASADLFFSGAFGLGVVSDEAFTAGAASIPRPFDDDDWAGWLVHGYYGGNFEFDSSGNTFFPYFFDIDSKAMRKVGPGQTLVWMVESQEGAVAVVIHARVLMLLS